MHITIKSFACVFASKENASNWGLNVTHTSIIMIEYANAAGVLMLF